ncbi:MAG: M28 family peptidase [Acidobacteriota bacterium]
MKNPTISREKLLAVFVLVSFVFAIACQQQVASITNSAAESKAEYKDSAFDAKRAFDHMKKVVDFGPRPSGSPAIKKTQEYIINELRSYGLKVMEDDFQGKTPKGAISMKNIFAELPGEKSDVVIISGHYDTKILANFVGANDGGSSTAAVLETARVLAGTKPEYTLWFVFFDGEEAVVEWTGDDNTYGSRHMVAKMKADGTLGKIRAMILYDMIGDKQLDLKRDGQSSKWLVDTIWRTAAQTLYAKHFLGNETYMSDDHVPFVEAGIPAVDLIDFNYGPDHTYWHTAQDTLDKVSGESVKAVGEVVIQSLPEIYKQLDARAANKPSTPNKSE